MERETRELPCRLTVEERSEKGIELVALHREVDASVAKATHARAQAKKRAKVIEEQIASGLEMRQVACEVGVEDGSWRCIRIDTGEVVEERPATVQELQRSLPLDGRNGRRKS